MINKTLCLQTELNKIEILSDVKFSDIPCSSKSEETLYSEPPKKKNRIEAGVQIEENVKIDKVYHKMKILNQKLRRRERKIKDLKCLLSTIKKNVTGTGNGDD